MITKQELRGENSKLQEKIIDLFQFQNSLEDRIIKDNKEIEKLRSRIKRFKEVMNKYRYDIEGLSQDCIDLAIDLRD
jgi:DNA repair exonuclease SbcCD ATPase subunit